MKLLEYKAWELFKKYQIPVMPGAVVDNVEEIADRIEEANLSYPVVVKAQVQIGGRGKAGGIKFADNAAQAKEIANSMLFSEVRGLKVRQLLLAQCAEIVQECYLSFMLDRESRSTIIIFSAMGGMDIEETAKTDPDKIVKLAVDPDLGIQDYDVRYLLDKSSMDAALLPQLRDILRKLYRMYLDYHCLLAEINPLAIVKDGRLVALDGKVDIDDSALYLLPDMQEFKELISIDSHPLVSEAGKYNFLYIPIADKGNVVAMSNGSGMLMNCVDRIVDKGLPVSAAMDLGGGATAERIREATRILLATPDTKILFASIFGGITRCDEVAKGIRDGLADSGKDVDIVIRVEGTNRDLGVGILNEIPGRVHIVNWPHEGVLLLEQIGGVEQ